MDFETFKRRKREGTLPKPSQIQGSELMTPCDLIVWGAAAYGLLILLGGR